MLRGWGEELLWRDAAIASVVDKRKRKKEAYSSSSFSSSSSSISHIEPLPADTDLQA
jgi:hypothetical protein